MRAVQIERRGPKPARQLHAAAYTVGDEWQEDFEAAGRRASDGDAPPDRRTIEQNRQESRRILSEAYGWRLSEAEIKAGLTALDIPRCRRRAPLPEPPE